MEKQMLAAVFEKEGKMNLKKVSVPTIQTEDEVLFKVRAASICGTDLHVLAVPTERPAKPNTIMGHEYTGQVVATGKAIRHLKEGDKVAVNPSLACGYCAACRLGLHNICDNMVPVGIYRDGGFAEYCVLPAKTLYEIPHTIEPELAVFTEPIACVLSAIYRVEPPVGQDVVILGAGPVGLLFLKILRMGGANKIIVSEISPYRRNYAKEFGADSVVNPKEGNLKEIVKELTGIGADLVVDAVGNLVAAAVPLVRKGGTIVLYGLERYARKEVRPEDIVRREVNIKGILNSIKTFPYAIRLLEKDKLQVRDLISHKIPLEKIHEGIALMRKGETLKVVVVPPGNE